MPDPREGCGFDSSDLVFLRNDRGTIWIIAQGFRDSSAAQAFAKKDEWRTLESGEVAHQPFSVYLKPGEKNTPFILFPSLHTSFSFIFTTKGHSDPTLVLRWLTPPTGEEYNEYFRVAKETVFQFVSELEAAKQKQIEQTDAPNYHAFGTFGTSPAEQAWVPKAIGSR